MFLFWIREQKQTPLVWWRPRGSPTHEANSGPWLRSFPLCGASFGRPGA